MKKIVLINLMALILFCNCLAQKQVHIAVIDLEGSGISQPNLQSFTNRLRAELFKTNKYLVLERSRMDEILKEQNFQYSGCTNTDCAVDIGRLLNVHYIVLGSVDKVGSLYAINLRLVNVETGKIDKFVTKDCPSCDITSVYQKTLTQAVWELAGLKLSIQDEVKKEKIGAFTFGLEVDTIPFILSGYNFSFYYGFYDFRIRLSNSKFDSPSFVWRDGFKDGENRVVGIYFDYLSDPNFSGLLLIFGVEYWVQSVGHEEEEVRADFENLKLNLGIGYVYNFIHNFSLGCSVSLLALTNGDTEIQVGDETAQLDKASVTATVTLGWHF